MVNRQELEKVCQDYNNLNDRAKEVIKEFLTGKNQQLGLSEEAQRIFYSLADKIAELIVDELDEKEQVEALLLEHGIDKETVDNFYPFCREASARFLSAAFINNMKKGSIRQAATFVINKMILYRDYESLLFEEFQKLTGYAEREKASGILSFINVYYTAVANRDISPSALENKFIAEYRMDRDVVRELIKPLLENASEMQQAHLNRLLNELMGRLVNQQSQ